MVEECQFKWRICAHVSKKHGLFDITRYEGPHTCVYPRLNHDYVQLDLSFIADTLIGIVQEEPTLNIKVIKTNKQDWFLRSGSHISQLNGMTHFIERVPASTKGSPLAS